MENSPTSFLLCKENLGTLNADYEQLLVDSYDEVYIKVLLDKEIEKGPQDLLQKSWIRLDGIDYILRKRGLLGFGFRTAYVSVSYLDRFLSIKDVEKPWAIRLLSMACLSLAAKMEEKRVAPLSEFCGEDYYFESSTIQRMELLVLNTLDWKMGSITPFDFIQFFADKLFDENSVSTKENAFSRTVQVILGSMRDAKTMLYKESVIAAGATLVVLDQGLTRDALELKISPLNSIHCFNTESIISCYGLLQKMEIERLKLNKGIKSPDLSPNMQLQTYGSSSVPSAKRKRLVFNQDDELGDEKKTPSSQ